MISGFLNPQSPVFIHFKLPKYFNEYKKYVGIFLESIICANQRFTNLESFWNLCVPNFSIFETLEDF